MAETQSSVLAFGRRGDQPVVVKVVKHPGDEWLSGAALQAFDGYGTVRVFEYFDGALLLERLNPGDSLTGMVHDRRDKEATDVLADVIGRMSPSRSFANMPTVEDWGRGFERHEARANSEIPKPLLDSARRVYFELSATQGARRLLHGDLHHDNILLDRDRGWLAIDPKGVVGESEYEVGAALRNPYERPELFTEPSTITSRVERFQRELCLDGERILAWAFAQAVLSAIWAIEDGCVVGPDNAWLALANNIRPMLRAPQRRP
jgi:streptomycin 6-kinase